MFRLFAVAVVSVLLGIAAGAFQQRAFPDASQDLFSGARPSQVEKEVTAEQTEQLRSGGQPKLEVIGGSVYNFQTMQHGETRSHEFVIRNAGDGPLYLDKGESTCKCTVGALDKRVLEPGEETKVKLTWTAQNATNEFSQSAKFYTNDPNYNELGFTVSGQVVNSYVIEPSELALGDFSTREGTTRSFFVFCYLDGAKAIKDFDWTNSSTMHLVEIDSKSVSADQPAYPQHGNAKSAYEVTVRLKPGFPIGPFSTMVNFGTDKGESIGLLSVPVSGRATSVAMMIGGSSFDANRNTLSFGTVKASEGAKVVLWLSVEKDLIEQLQPWVESVNPAESLQVSIGEPKAAGQRVLFPVSLEVPKGAPSVSLPGNSKSSFGKVVLKTKHESVPELPIHLRLIVE